MWERASTKLVSGPHGMDPALVAQIQRERLMRAVCDVAAEVGYANTTTRMLVGRAGVSRRTYYELFADKEACFLAAYDEAIACVLGLLRDAYDESDPPELRIRSALRALLAFCADEPAIARACVVEVLAAGPAARARRAHTMTQLAALVEQPLRELRGGDRLAKLSARALVGAVHELIYIPVDGGVVDNLPALADEIVDSQLIALAPT